jgi:aminodeoxyfutalosine deaminase
MTHTSTISSFVEGLPKVELHVHLEGTVTPEFWRRLLKTHQPKKRLPSIEELRKRFIFHSFKDFIIAMKDVMLSFRSPEDFYQLTKEYLVEAASHNVRYCELMCTPWFMERQGIDSAEIIAEIDRAAKEVEREKGIEMALILDGPRNLGNRVVKEVFETASKDRTGRVIGVGLGGDEKNNPARYFLKEFQFARSVGLKTIAHAGETDGEHSMVDAIQLLGVSRIGHCLGIQQSSELEELILEKGITLDLCPASNVATRCLSSIEQHPLPDYLKRGYPVTLNSDDPGFFNSSISTEFITMLTIFNLSFRQLADISTNAVNGSFLPKERKRGLIEEIERYYHPRDRID